MKGLPGVARRATAPMSARRGVGRRDATRAGTRPPCAECSFSLAPAPHEPAF